MHTRFCITTQQQPYVDMCMHSASEGLKIDNVELHEFAYTFFANLAKVMKIKMAPYLPVLVPHLLAEVRNKLAPFRRETC
jgi:hypothetical protein